MAILRRRRHTGEAPAPEVYYSERQRREAFVATGLASVIRLSLGVALMVCAVQAYLVLRAPIAGLAPEARWVLPGLMGAGSLFALRMGARDLKRALATRSAPVDPGFDDDPDPRG